MSFIPGVIHYTRKRSIQSFHCLNLVYPARGNCRRAGCQQGASSNSCLPSRILSFFSTVPIVSFETS
ncbi:hypothetical protein EJB05_57937, partial [Eragrostis curvula]